MVYEGQFKDELNVIEAVLLVIQCSHIIAFSLALVTEVVFYLTTLYMYGSVRSCKLYLETHFSIEI